MPTKLSDWKNDPDLQEEIRMQGIRRSLVRNAIIWTPIALVALGLLLFFAFDQITGGNRGSWFFVGVLTVLNILVGYQSLSALRDLLGSPAVIEGYVTRRWSRTDSFVMRSHYIRIAKKILRVDGLLHGDVDQGDYLRVEYYPHSAIVIRVSKIDPPGKEPRSASSSAASSAG